MVSGLKSSYFDPYLTKPSYKIVAELDRNILKIVQLLVIVLILFRLCTCETRRRIIIRWTNGHISPSVKNHETQYNNCWGVNGRHRRFSSQYKSNRLLLRFMIRTVCVLTGSINDNSSSSVSTTCCCYSWIK